MKTKINNWCVLVVALFCLAFCPLNATAEYAVTARPFLTEQQHALLEEMLNTHLNYFLSSDAITKSGLPLGGYKEGDRGRYNYSNPTEWGYALQAWVVAAERGVIQEAAAVTKIETALNTISALQNDPTQNYQNLFYPYYYVADRSGQDLDVPYHDGNFQIPSIDNGFLTTSLLIVEGWAKSRGLSELQSKAQSISSKMNFRMFFKPSENLIYHVINATTGQLGTSKWDIYSDEGGAMAWIAYLSGSITFNEFQLVIDTLSRVQRTWNGITTDESAWFNAMFAWGVRSLAGFPVATRETGINNKYSASSFAPAVNAHLAYGSWLGVDYPAFSDAMTQPNGVGRYTPPNISNTVPTDVPAYVVPHAFFIPFCVGPDLDSATLTTLLNKIADLKNDSAGYYHSDGADGHKPFGFEVTASPYKNATAFKGSADGRYIYETLSEAYILLSLYQGLTINDGKQNLLHFAGQVSGYPQNVSEALGYLYPEQAVLRVPDQYATIQQAIDAAQSGDTIQVAAGTYKEALYLKSGVTLKGTGGSLTTPDDPSDDAVIDGYDTVRPIMCNGVSGAVVEGFTVANGAALISGGNIACYGFSVTIKNNLITNGRTIGSYGGYGGGVTLGGANNRLIGNVISNNWTWAQGGGVYSNADNTVINGNIIRGNTADYGGGIWSKGRSEIISNNLVDGNFSNYATGGGISINGTFIQLINNTIVNNRAGQWQHGYGGGLYVSTDASDIHIINNIVADNSADNSTGGVYCEASQPVLEYNDVYNNTRGDYYGCTAGEGSLAEDPLFINAGADYRLQSGSPCVDAGNPSTLYNDLDGTRNDLGAYGGSPEWTLNVNLAGNGTGVVTSVPAGISCGEDCTESYFTGTQITLTALAADDSTFGGWSGACAGTDTTCTINGEGGKTVTATFIGASEPGDCNGDGQVSIAEVQGAINMYLGLKETASCVDTDGSGNASIAEVQKVINGYLGL